MIKLPPVYDEDYLFLILIHTIQERFSNHAILKGGMVLKLLGSTRRTLDLDYTFIPFKSKNEVLGDLKELFSSIEGATVRTSINSKTIRLIIKTKGATVQVEVNVCKKCKSVPISTRELTKNSNVSPKVIKVMSYDVSLANKLAAWFERRLVRDLYDIYFLSTVAGPDIDMPTLKERLDNVESRIPHLKKIKKISVEYFFYELKGAVEKLDENSIRKELSGFISDEEIAGLDLIIRRAVIDLINRRTH